MVERKDAQFGRVMASPESGTGDFMMRRSVGGRGGGGEIHLADHITAWELFGQMGDGFASGQVEGDNLSRSRLGRREYAFEMGLDDGQFEYGDVFGQDEVMR
ncbi:hypothetical protein G3M48_007067 [Beauveria asiatica]|uniref:Uncharacterized protein n=1 Tax=Beauveria asiatica TaxID=1069075 RepID=A0AAW0RNN4_9HYPO